MAYFMPRHCREPLLNATMYLRRWAEEGWSQRAGEKVCGEGKRWGLKCVRMEVMPTGVCD